MATIKQKADYVRTRLRDDPGGHHCHWPGCTHNEMAEWVRDRMVEEPYWDSNRREETEEERAKRLAEDRAIHAAITRNIRGRHW